MNNSANFKKAHEVAKQTAHIVGDYRIAFSLALKTVVKTAKLAKQLGVMQLSLHKQIGMKNGTANAFECLVHIYNETVKLNTPKKQSYNWSKFDDSESGCY